MNLKILSWNIWFDSKDFGSICEYIEKNPADIIGMQEVSDDPSLDIVSFMSKLGYNNVFTQAATANSHGKKYGNAIFSKYPLTNKRDLILSKEKSRNAIGADVVISDKTFHIFSVHLIHDHQTSSDIQNEQADNLIKAMPSQNTILMGDFNAEPTSFAIQQMSKNFVNSDPNNLPTWSLDPAGCPGCNPNGVNIKLDYIFATADIKMSDPKVEAAKGSDHLPVSINVEV